MNIEQAYVNDIISVIEANCGFLEELGYQILDQGLENTLIFKGKNNCIQLSFYRIAYEIDCSFVDCYGNGFSLDDVLTYINVDSYKGNYQMSKMDEMSAGIAYLLDVLAFVFRKIDLSSSSEFKRVYEFSEKQHAERLRDYYTEHDLEKAELYWKSKEYEKAREILETHKSHLSKLQQKQLDYINDLLDKG